MLEIHVDKVDATEDRAREVQELTLQDLLDMGMPLDEARQIANPESGEMIDRQRLRLKEYPRRYLGATAIDGSDDKLLGVIKYNRWGVVDEANASSGVRRRVLRVRSRIDNRMPGDPLGIFGYTARGDLDPELHERVLRLLAQPVVGEADTEGVEVRISLTDNDPAKKILVGRAGLAGFGFRSTDTHGKPIGNVIQRLYVRPPLNRQY